MDIPTTLVLLGFAIALGGTLRALLSGAGGAKPFSKGLASFLFAILALWGAAIGILAHASFFLASPESTAPMFLLGWLPGLALVAWVGMSPRLRAALVDLSPSHLIAMHVSRFATGLAMVHAGLIGTLPQVFAMPAGIGGLVVGGASLWSTYALARGTAKASSWARRWNGLGLLDILLAMILGGLTGPGPSQVLSPGFPSTASTAFPLAIIPAFLVPLYLLAHTQLWAILRHGGTDHSQRRG